MATTPQVFRTQWAAQAKRGFSDLFTEAVNHGHPQLVQRKGSAVSALVSSTEDIRRWLATAFRFTTTVAASDGEFVARIPELNIIGAGGTFEEAMEELKGLALDYAILFFERIAFYKETDRAVHEPYLVLLALTPPEKRRALLLGDPSSDPTVAPEVARKHAVA